MEIYQPTKVFSQKVKACLIFKAVCFFLFGGALFSDGIRSSKWCMEMVKLGDSAGVVNSFAALLFTFCIFNRLLITKVLRKWKRIGKMRTKIYTLYFCVIIYEIVDLENSFWVVCFFLLFWGWLFSHELFLPNVKKYHLMEISVRRKVT